MITKKVITATINKKLHSDWIKYVKKNSLNTSQIIEKFLTKQLEKRK